MLAGNQQVRLSADMPHAMQDAAGPKPLSADQIAGPFDIAKNAMAGPQKVLTRALDDFVVQRGAHQSVIAGYPWFLDWGRDALIFVRGVIAARQLTTARAILKQFGQFEQQGTLPNMIQSL